MKKFNWILLSAAFGAATVLGYGSISASAQPMPQGAAAADPQPAPDLKPDMQTNCGTWQSGTWVPSGACAANDYRSHVAGTITAVKGHLVTLQQSEQTFVINDQPALDRRTTGRIAVGRQVNAAGYWRNGTFYATSVV
jgi:hypothetical protein